MAVPSILLGGFEGFQNDLAVFLFSKRIAQGIVKAIKDRCLQWKNVGAFGPLLKDFISQVVPDIAVAAGESGDKVSDIAASLEPLLSLPTSPA